MLFEKLNRIIQYAEASVCRRKILLSYFSEELPDNCGNCDVCQNPPSYFDASELCQKALSAVKRADEKLNTNLLIDVLRGAKTSEIFSLGLHEIKTWGVGKSYSWKDWQHYITEMKNNGVFEIAYNDHMRLKTTAFGKRILYGEAKLFLSHPVIEQENLSKNQRKPEVLSEDELLFDRLRLLRKKLAVEKNVPAYLIFSDASLREMAAHKPVSKDAFLTINGVGELKARHYSEDFITLIRQYIEDSVKQVPV